MASCIQILLLVFEKRLTESQENQNPAVSGDFDKISARLNYLEIQIEKKFKIQINIIV